MKNILFVGERISGNKTKIPFDRNYPTGKFLYQSLCCLPAWIYFTCSFHFDNVYISNRINRKLKTRQFSFDRVIALGVKSFKELIKMRIPCVYVPHPSFYKRFKSERGYYGYSKVIEEAIINGK